MTLPANPCRDRRRQRPGQPAGLFEVLLEQIAAQQMSALEQAGSRQTLADVEQLLAGRAASRPDADHPGPLGDERQQPALQ
jgi:hypothetical protein